MIRIIEDVTQNEITIIRTIRINYVKLFAIRTYHTWYFRDRAMY